jgi:hypothetical protein
MDKVKGNSLSPTGLDRLQVQIMAMLAKPVAVLPVLRHNGGHAFPETRGVVLFSQMREFVDNDIIDNGFRCHNQPPAEIEVARAAAGPPSLGGAGYPYFVV